MMKGVVLGRLVSKELEEATPLHVRATAQTPPEVLAQLISRPNLVKMHLVDIYELEELPVMPSLTSLVSRAGRR